MSETTRRWRGAVLAFAVVAAFAGGLLALDSSAQLADFSWSAPASEEGQ
ncbi:hypothetical protein [Salinispora tropica]|nr:hypothetical protein [Salinispora tropica]